MADSRASACPDMPACLPPLTNHTTISYPSLPAGAKPVLKSGERFPCITLHYLPSLEPVATLAGPGAVEQLRAALREHAPAAAQPAVVAAAPVSAPAAAAAPASGSLVALKRGAAEFKEVLAAARDATQPVIVIWRSSSAGAGDSAAGTALLAAAVQAAGGVVVVDADVSASNSIQLLAGALKVAAFPEVHAYRGMKLESKLAPAQATPAALLRLAALLAPAAAGGTIASTRANGNTAAATAAAAPSVAALAAEQPLAVAPSSRGDGTWDPPGGKFAKPGATRRFPDGRLGHFFPKMPCLRCLLWVPYWWLRGLSSVLPVLCPSRRAATPILVCRLADNLTPPAHRPAPCPSHHCTCPPTYPTGAAAPGGAARTGMHAACAAPGTASRADTTTTASRCRATAPSGSSWWQSSARAALPLGRRNGSYASPPAPKALLALSLAHGTSCKLVLCYASMPVWVHRAARQQVGGGENQQRRA